MKKMKKKYKITIASILILVIIGFILNFQNYKYPDKEGLQLKVNYLERIIKSPMDKNSDLTKIGSQSSEWMLFSLSFSTFALTNIAFLDTTFKNQSIELIDFAIQKALTDTIYNAYFGDKNPFEPEIDTNGSILYFGHLNNMLGCYRLLSTDTKYNELNNKLSESLFNRFSTSKNMCLPSYSFGIWIPDNTAGLASLKLHSLNTGSQYDKICEKWIEYAKTNFIDEETGLLCSTINLETGKIKEEPRGSMIGWSIFFIYRFDKEFAKEQYEIYKSKFSNNLGVIRLFNERYKNNKTDFYGDIDSGPIIWGYSIPAIAFAFGDAVAMKDWRNAKRLERVIKLGSKTKQRNNEIKYKTRFINMEISPLAEALILYFETMTEWTK